MTELESILIAFDKAKAEGKKSALATVVHVEGSSYRRPGARMLITEDGAFTGSISGGCLEGDALRKAMHAIHSTKKILVTYDTSDEDDAKLGMGLGCQGVIQVLFEPILANDDFCVIDLLKKIYHKRQKAALITLFSLADKKAVQTGSCFLLMEDGSYAGNTSILPLELLKQEAFTVIEEQKSSFRSYETASQEIIAFTEIIQPSVKLVIAGAGNDVVPLVNMADILGWKTTVIDGRPLYANKERFQAASCQVFLSKPENSLEQIQIDERTVFVLMTHNYNYDLAMLKALLSKQITYIGILGPRKKFEKMIDELSAHGIVLSSDQLSIIHSPVGLHIGAETAEEIALSIIAEIKSVLSATVPKSLRNHRGTIHHHSDYQIQNISLAK